MADELTDVFFDVQSDLPRQGPGDSASTRRALASCRPLPSSPRVLDVGCGPGAQTLVLAGSLPGAGITAIDIHPPYLDELRARAAAAGVADRVDARSLSMDAIDYAPRSFDLLWAEGSAYIMGFVNAVAAWRSLLGRGGFLAVSELVWLTADRPPEAVEFFGREYPAMTDCTAVAGSIRAAGYVLVDTFTLPDAAWWDGYYTPLLARLPALETKYAQDAAALSVIEATRREIDVRRRYASSYGYQFFVARRTD